MNLSGVDPNLSLELLIGLEALKFSTSIRLSLLSKPQLNHNSTQPNITLSWVTHENDFAHHPTPPPPTTTETQCQQYLSCYWPDFAET